MEPVNNTTSLLQTPESTRLCFIESNTVPASLQEIKNRHIIPTYSKDAEPLISQGDFIETAFESVKEYYSSQTVLAPSIRLSHPILGRIPEARNKPLQYLEERDKTVYYDRCAFIIEIPSIQGEVDLNPLSLTIGGVQAYHLNNLHSRKGSDEYFKIFIGFKNTVCCNLKVWSDGLMDDVKVRSLGELRGCFNTLLQKFDVGYQLHTLKAFEGYHLSEKQFAQLIGRCRLYNFLPQLQRHGISPMLLGDQQIGTVCRDFYRDSSFCKDENGNINLWRLYNLFTGANKSSYIDTFIQRGANAFQLIQELKMVLDKKASSWFLN
jgi:hypothetical protein